MSTSTRVVHKNKSSYDVYIGRPSKWGNPFAHFPGTLAVYQVKTRDEAIASYRAWILNQPELLAQLGELRGKTLGCWCSPLPCHGDVLAELCDKGVPAAEPQEKEASGE